MTLEQLSAAAKCPNPFCKNSAPQIIKRGDCYMNGWLVVCRSCGIEGPYIAAVAQTLVSIKTDEQAEAAAITAWNTRTGQLVEVQADDATVERVKDAIGTSLAYDIGMDVRAGSLTDDEKRKLARKAIAAMKGPKP